MQLPLLSVSNENGEIATATSSGSVDIQQLVLPKVRKPVVYKYRSIEGKCCFYCGREGFESRHEKSKWLSCLQEYSMDRLKGLIANHPEALFSSSRARIAVLENNWLKIIEGENALLTSVWICRFTTRNISISPGDQSCSYGYRLHNLECQIVRKQRKMASSDTQCKQDISDVVGDIVPDNDATDAYDESDEPQIHDVGSSSNSVEVCQNMQSIGSSLSAIVANTTTSFNDIDESITQNVNGFDGEMAAEASLTISDHADPKPVIQVRIITIDMAWYHLFIIICTVVL